jgi:ABC-type amino acid transport substrate-binding protein
MVAAAALALVGCGGSSTSGDNEAGGLGLLTPGELVVGSDISFPPFEFTDSGSGTPSGFDVDLVNAIARRLGISKVVFRDRRFDAIFTATSSGAIDMAASAITITPQREQEVDFSRPYFEDPQAILARADDAAAFGGSAAATLTPRNARVRLTGHHIGVVRGTSGASFAQGIRPATVQRYRSLDRAFEDLAARRLDTVIINYSLAANATISRPDLRVVAKMLPSATYGFAFGTDKGALREAFDRGLVQTISSGEFARIYRRWFNDDPPPRIVNS